mmetsp:Transcript_15981/g.52053  ORF Transcript_15981/g.52053 Transcript_15981/m.52053 type:complete len:184 (-) Transcript_15981:30-581(-)
MSAELAADGEEASLEAALVEAARQKARRVKAEARLVVDEVVRAELAVERCRLATAEALHRQLTMAAREVATNATAIAAEVTALRLDMTHLLDGEATATAEASPMEEEEPTSRLVESPTCLVESPSPSSVASPVELERLGPTGGFDAARVFEALGDEDVKAFLAANRRRFPSAKSKTTTTTTTT